MERFSFSGKGNILIKAGVAGKYGGESYAANEPIAYMTDILVNINFSYIDKVSRTGVNNLTADSKAAPSFLSISNIKVTDSLQSLLYKKQVDKTKNKTIIKNLVSTSGLLFLPLETGQTITGDIFIYNSDKERVTTFTVDGDKILGLGDDKYTVFYSVDSVSKATYFLENPTCPNIAAEIHVLGNVNSKDGEVVMHFNKLKLLSRPTLDFNSNSPFVDTLEFAILSEDNVEVNYYG